MGSVEPEIVPSHAERSATLEDRINNAPLVKKLRADPMQKESRPHSSYSTSTEWRNLVANTLIGPGMIEIAPFVWTQKEENTLTMVFPVGNNMCGHPGIIHGGFSASIFDEALARCAFPVLPSKVGATANLQIDYKKPVMANQILVLKAKVTEFSGRKAWVEGSIESLIEDESLEEEVPVPLVTAKGLFVEPRNTFVSGV
ncbi:hypothetical protein DH86_00003888 [Scytalidium sp. 3C]|nr:hypothetical protein DH86_00003888 [Scytalidium sp. 3C]